MAHWQQESVTDMQTIKMILPLMGVLLVAQAPIFAQGGKKATTKAPAKAAAKADPILEGIKGKPLKKKLDVLLNPMGSYSTEFMNWMSKKKFMADSIRFINAAQYKKDKPEVIYATYIKDKAKLQINISGAMRKQFDDLAAAGQYSKMKWDAALTQMMGLQDFDKIVEEYLTFKTA
jgi:hypothetical protein